MSGTATLITTRQTSDEGKKKKREREEKADLNVNSVLTAPTIHLMVYPTFKGV